MSTSAEARPFTPADDVELALFQYAGQGSPGGVLKLSPDGRYLAIVTERGRLDLNAPEDTIWIYRLADVQHFMRHPETDAPVGFPLARTAGDKNGPLIEHVRWLPDSSAIAFTAIKKSLSYKFHQLYVADIASHAVRTLTPEDQDVGDFDIRSRTSYVYEVNSPTMLAAPPKEGTRAKVLTGKGIWDTLFPSSNHLTQFAAAGLWAVVDGQRHHVLQATAYEPTRGGGSLALSPDGRTTVAIIKTERAPEATWARYRPPPGYDKANFPLDTSAYHLIDLTTGATRLLINAPSGQNQDWHSYLLRASWSPDGQALLLPNTFFPLDVTDPNEIAQRESHPYIAVLRLKSGRLTKVFAIRAGLDKQRYAVQDARFEDNRTVVINFDRSEYLREQPPTAIFRQLANETWRRLAATEDPRLARLPIKMEKHEGINDPPVFVAKDRKSGLVRVFWDPNPQLKDIELGSAEVVKWKDESGYEWEAGLLKPPGYTPGKRYPLVIQTHGFAKDQFLSNGIFSSAFAARALAAQGIIVLQMGWNPTNFDTPKEGPDQVRGFESIVKKLADEGVIDPERVGAIGFSRSVYHVLFAMTAAKSLFAATSVTDGVDFGYFQYLISVDRGFDSEADPINGGKPFRNQGLEQWLAHSPEFNMDNVLSPLLLLQPGAAGVFAGWGAYATLRYLKRPVDLIMLQPGTHVMTNPTQRLAAETVNVDWFRFWLQGYEDPDPAKAEQYQRWRSLRALRDKNAVAATAAR